MKESNYNGLPRNIFDDSSISAIKNANRYSPNMERATPAQFKETFKETTKEQTQEAGVFDIQPSLDSLRREFELKITKQMELIDKIIGSQNQMIKEFNELVDRVKRLEARPVQQVVQQVQAPQMQQNQASAQSAPQQQASAPASSSQGPLVSEAATSDTSSKTMLKQQTSAGSGLDPKAFSVEKYFYFGNK